MVDEPDIFGVKKYFDDSFSQSDRDAIEELRKSGALGYFREVADYRDLIKNEHHNSIKPLLQSLERNSEFLRSTIVSGKRIIELSNLIRTIHPISDSLDFGSSPSEALDRLQRIKKSAEDLRVILSDLSDSSNSSESQETEEHIPEEKKRTGKEKAERIILCNYHVIEAITKNPNLIHMISPREFEEIIAEIYSQNGFDVELTPESRDGGKDIIVDAKDSLGTKSRYYIECKKYKEGRTVGIDIVRQLFGVVSADKVSKGIIVTTSTFTSGAKDFALNQLWNLELKDHDDVLYWIKKLNADKHVK